MVSESHPDFSHLTAFNRPIPGYQFLYLENGSDEGAVCPGCDSRMVICSKQVELSGSVFSSAELSLCF